MEKGLHSKFNCPNCKVQLTRIKRSDTERLLNKLTFRKFYNKKFLCYSCLQDFYNIKVSKNKDEVETFINTYSLTIKAALPALTLLVIVVAAMIMLSESFNPNTLTNNFSFFRE